MRFRSKYDKARALVLLNMVKVISRDKEGRVKSALVSGSQTKTYKVIFWRKNGSIQCECWLTTPAGDLVCQSGSCMCYHALAVLIVSAKEGDRNISFSPFLRRRKTYQIAKRFQEAKPVEFRVV